MHLTITERNKYNMIVLESRPVSYVESNLTQCGAITGYWKTSNHLEKFDQESSRFVGCRL